MSQNYLYFKNNLNYHSLLMGDKGLTSKPLFRLTPPTFWRPMPRSLSTISFTPKSFTMAFGIRIHPCLLLAVASSLEDKPTRARTLPIWFRGTPRTSHSAWHAVDTCPTNELKSIPPLEGHSFVRLSPVLFQTPGGRYLTNCSPSQHSMGFFFPWDYREDCIQTSPMLKQNRIENLRFLRAITASVHFPSTLAIPSVI